jgi:hypothetical protein
MVGPGRRLAAVDCAFLAAATGLRRPLGPIVTRQAFAATAATKNDRTRRAREFDVERRHRPRSAFWTALEQLVWIHWHAQNLASDHKMQRR